MPFSYEDSAFNVYQFKEIQLSRQKLKFPTAKARAYK